MAIKTISQFAAATPTASDKILFEQNGEGRHATIGDIARATGINLDLLWQNASPASSFASQTISIDSSAHKIVYIVFYGYATATSELYTMSFIDKSRGYVTVGWYGAQYSERGTSVSPKEIAFTNAKTGGTTNNSYLVPYKIYGVR